MSIIRKERLRIKRRVYRVRNRFDAARPRVSVFRSLRHLSAQVIDDRQQITLVSGSTSELMAQKKTMGKKTDVAHALGLELARKALDQGIHEIAFDRGPYRYHGRVKALADGLREGGIKF